MSHACLSSINFFFLEIIYKRIYKTFNNSWNHVNTAIKNVTKSLVANDINGYTLIRENAFLITICPILVLQKNHFNIKSALCARGSYIEFKSVQFWESAMLIQYIKNSGLFMGSTNKFKVELSLGNIFNQFTYHFSFVRPDYYTLVQRLNW